MAEETRMLTADIELRTDVDNNSTAIGYAAKFNSLSSNLGGFVESIAPGAFTQTLATGTGVDARALWNHDSGQLLGRMSAETLNLVEDEVGLRFEIDLPNTTTGRDVRELLNRGDVQGASFGFRVIDDSWGETEQGYPLRELRSVSLSEVSLVTFPAYPETEVALRSLADNKDLSFDDVAAAAAANELKSLIDQPTEPQVPGETHTKVPRSAGYR